MMDEIMRQEERILLKEPLNKSSAAGKLIFFPIHAEWKSGNTRSIPLFSILLSEEKSLADSSCRFNQSFPYAVYLHSHRQPFLIRCADYRAIVPLSGQKRRD